MKIALLSLLFTIQAVLMPHANADEPESCPPGQSMSTMGHYGAHVCMSSNAYQSEVMTKSFTGMSWTYGMGPCGAVPIPSLTDAEKDAQKVASDYCSDFGLDAKLISEFEYFANYCRAAGQGYRFISNTLRATATFNCQ